MSGTIESGEDLAQTELERLSDGDLVAEADRAWQRGDTARIEQVKAERARRKVEAARQRAMREVKEGGMSLCAFAGLMAVLIVISALRTGRMVNLVDLVIPVGLAGLSYYVFRGNRIAAVAGFVIALAILFLNIRFAKLGVIWLGMETTAAGGSWLAVRGSFALRKLAGAEGLAGYPSPCPLPQGEGDGMRVAQGEGNSGAS